MKKSLKRLIALTIVAGLTATSLINFQANAASSKSILSLDTAISAAIDNSYQISIAEDKQDMLEDKQDFYDDNEFDDDGYNDIQISQNEQKKNFLEDQISADVTSKYNSIIIMEEELENLNAEIEMKNKDYKDMELKKQLGLVTMIQMQSAKAELDKLKADKKSKEEELKNSKAIFEIITDIDINNYELEDTVRYKALKIEDSLDSYLDNKINTYFRYNKKLAEWAEDNYSSSAGSEPTFTDKEPKLEDFNGDVNAFNAAKDKWKEKYKDYQKNRMAWIMNSRADFENEYNSNTAVDSINDAKRGFKQTLINTYTSLVTLESNISAMQSQLDVLKNKSSITKLQYDVGLVTKQDYDKQVLATEELEISLNSLINNYNDLKEKIEKPWVLAAGK